MNKRKDPRGNSRVELVSHLYVHFRLCADVGHRRLLIAEDRRVRVGIDSQNLAVTQPDVVRPFVDLPDGTDVVSRRKQLVDGAFRVLAQVCTFECVKEQRHHLTSLLLMSCPSAVEVCSAAKSAILQARLTCYCFFDFRLSAISISRIQFRYVLQLRAMDRS